MNNHEYTKNVFRALNIFKRNVFRALNTFLLNLFCGLNKQSYLCTINHKK